MESNNVKTKKKNWKKKLNIALSILLVLGLLSSSFGGYTLAQSLNENTSKTNGHEEDEETSDDGQNMDDEDAIPFTDISGGDGLNNEMTLTDDVKVFSERVAAFINSSIVSVEVVGNSFISGEQLEIKLSGERDRLFDELNRGDIFVLEGNENTPLGETYILKVDNIYESDGEVTLQASQPYFDEVFDNIALNIHEALREENLIDAITAPGVEMYFGNIEEEFTNVVSAGDISIGDVNGPVGESEIQLQTLAMQTNTIDEKQFKTLTTETQFAPMDIICEINVDLKGGEDKKGSDGGILDVDADMDFKIKGKYGIKDLTAYMVCDMPKPLQFNELFFGARGEAFVEVGFSAELSASFHGRETEMDVSFLGVNAKATALNEKLIPLGIWMFAGTTPIKISSSSYRTMSVFPTMFLMIYSDWEGNISLEFTASFEYKEKFNGGLRVVKDGDLAMNMENYPYNVGNERNTNEENLTWNIGLELEAETDLTLLGGSILFCIGGLNIGELALVRIGMEAECNLEVKANSETGVEIPNSQDSSYYLRLYLRLGEVKVRLKADINILWNSWGFEFDFEYCLVDLTLFKIGNMPNRYTRTPVTSKMYPHAFDSVITLVCDVSGSMNDRTGTGETKLEAAKEAGTVIVSMVEKWSKQYPGEYGIGVVQFGSGAKTLAFPHIDYPFIDDCIQFMNEGGGTNIASGLEIGIEQIENVTAKSKVIILMTDGIDNNHSEILKQAEKAKAKNIRVFTVGFGEDIEASILTQVAEETGGEYRFADTNNIVGIIGSFMYAQQASEAIVLTDEQGAVHEGKTTSAKSFTVPDETGDLNCILYWPGSILDLIIEDPNGRIVDEDYPNAVINDSTIPVTIVVSEPLPGNWKMRVKGVETSPEYVDGEPYYVITSFKEIEHEAIDIAPKLKTIEMLGAYALPIGVLMTLMSVMLLIFINSKKKIRKETDKEN